MYTNGEYYNDLENWQKAVGNLDNDFEAVCKQLKYSNLINTYKELRALSENGLIDYSEAEYAKDIVSLLDQCYGIDMTKQLKNREDDSE